MEIKIGTDGRKQIWGLCACCVMLILMRYAGGGFIQYDMTVY